ncbi:glycerophosphodiester phosphodiesterase [Pilimelia columellifera]|uniref:Glycerophosphodiester phosphodiesterase n=1 Tax=Pilimelia columellifera subsp. columellifera TaxID=706583 RepID=A0ABN3NBA5_9ACTN
MSVPLVFAHRGASAELPEHTLAAYLRALEAGADGLECDVRMTRDGHLVCVHDRRLDRTSNGRGPVSRRTLAELAELDFGSWHAATRGSDLDGAARPGTGTVGVLTLNQLLDHIDGVRQPVRLLVETKHPTRHGGAVERSLRELLARRGLHRARPDARVRVSVMSFSPLAVRRMRALAPAVPTVQLLDLLPSGLTPPGLGRLPVAAPVVGPSVELLRARPGLAPALRAAGKRVYVWTVNEPDDIDLAVSLGVDGLITDRPAEVRERLG